MQARANIFLLLLGITVLPFNAFAQDPIDIPDIGAIDLEGEFEIRTSDEPSYQYSEEIPAPSDRVDGPRVRVHQIIFERLGDYPEISASAEELYEMVDQRRAELAAENRELSSGYTEGELVEFADLLKQKISANENGELTEADLRDLNNTLKRQKWERGLTYAQIEGIADEIKKYYREKGMFLARAVIPEQEVINGIIMLKIVEGRLGNVTVAENSIFSTEQILKPFEAYIGKPLMNHQMEEAFYVLNDYPGLSAFGFFAAGEKAGETVLNLQVSEEKQWSLALNADNHGSRFTGDRRLFLNAIWFNPLGRADMLNLGLLQSSSPDNTKLGMLNYHTPIIDPYTHLRLSATYNDFSVEDESNPALNSLQISGINTAYEVGLMRRLTRTRQYNAAVIAAVAEKEADIDARVALPSSGDHTRMLELGARLEGLSEARRLLAMLVIKGHYGEYLQELPSDRKDRYSKISADISMLKLFTSPFYEAESRLVINSRVVYGNTVMPSYEQQALGGASAVRGFKVNDFSADRGVYLGAEWYWDLPEELNPTIGDFLLNDLFQVALFVDGAYGTEIAKSRNAENQWAHISAAGLLFKIEMPDLFQAEVSFAHPLTSKSSQEKFATEQKEWRIYANFTFFYD